MKIKDFFYYKWKNIRDRSLIEKRILVVLLLLLPAFPLEITYKNIDHIALAHNSTFFLQGKKNYLLKVDSSDYLIGYLPTLGASYDWSLNIRREEADANPNSITLYVNQPILKNGAFFSQLGQQTMDYLISFWNLEKNKKQFLLDTRKGYLDLLLKKQEILVNQQFLGVLADELEIARKRFDLSEIIENDYLEIMSQYQETELQLLQNRMTYREGLRNLRNRLEIPPKETLVLRENLADDFYVVSKEIDFTPYHENYLRANLDLRVQEFEIKKNTYIRDTMYWNLIPRIDLNLYYTFKDDALQSASAWEYPFRKRDWGLRIDFQFDFGQSQFSTSGEIKENLYDGNRDFSTKPRWDIFTENTKNIFKNREMAIADQNLLHKQFLKTYTELENNFQSVVENIDISQKVLKLQKLKLITDQKRVEIIYQQYLLGEVGVTDYLKKRVDFRNLEIQYYQQLSNFITLVTTLELEMGMTMGYFGTFASRTDGGGHE